MRNVFLLSFILLFFSNHISAQGRSIEYSEFNQVLDLVQNKVSSKYFVCVFKVNVINKTLTLDDVKVWLAKDGKVIAKGQLDNDGNITLPVLEQEQAEDVMLHISHSKDDVAITLRTDVAPITQTQVSYRELFSMLKDLNHFISVMAGNMSWLVPSMDEIEFTFTQVATISFIDEKGRTKLFRSDDEHKIEIPLKKAWMKFDPKLMFSELPKNYTPVL